MPETMIKAPDLLRGGGCAESFAAGAQRPTVADLEARDKIVSRALRVAGTVAGTYALYAGATWLLLAAAGM